MSICRRELQTPSVELDQNDEAIYFTRMILAEIGFLRKWRGPFMTLWLFWSKNHGRLSWPAGSTGGLRRRLTVVHPRVPMRR